MKRTNAIWAAGAAALMLWTAPAWAGKGGKLQGWMHQFEEGQQQAKAQKKPLLLYFTQDG